MARVVLNHLVKEYVDPRGTSVRAVDDVSLTVEDGEFMVLVGPSGCGKSTTLRMIAGLEAITAGTIEIDGRAVNDVAPKDRDIAMVFQSYALYPHMTVYENMAFGLQLRKLPRSEIEARVAEAADMLGLRDFLERLPKALSGGQRQRVALGRAVVRRPKVFLFDEPLSNLDAKMRVSMRAEISRLHDRLGATMIYVTHDQVEAMTMGDRICVMKDGRVMQIAEPLTVYDRPENAFVAGFIGSPPMNFLRGELRSADSRWYFVTHHHAESWSLRLPYGLGAQAARAADGAVILGIRPENVEILPDNQRPPADLIAAPAHVEAVEPLGAETFVHLSASGHPLIARVPSSLRPILGERITAAFNPARLHLFDAQAGWTL
jgi:ABC-type sugar transport systems, ATPase components